MELGRYNTPAEAQRYVDMYGKGAKVKKEEVELDEIDEKISDIFKANKEGESVEDIAKRLKLSTSMVKKLIGEAKDEEEKKEEPKKEENKESEIQSLKDQIAMLKQKLENEKNKAIKPEPNPETGEVPLTIGIAHAEFKKKKEEVKEAKYEVTSTVTYQGVRGEDEVSVVVDAMDEDDAEANADDMIDDLRKKKKIGPKTGGQVKDVSPFDVERTSKKVGSYEGMMESMSKAERDKRIQRAKDMIK